MATQSAAVVAILLLIGVLAAEASKLDLISAGQAQEQSLEQAWSKELDETENKVVKHKSPIQRVVSLLEEMKAQLAKEGSDESEMYDKMVCWCETNEKEKTEAIAAADAKDIELIAEIEERSAKSGELATNIAALKKQIAADEETVKTATAIREKEAAEFAQEEKELIQAITNLKNAIQILSKHNSFLQTNSPTMVSLREVLRDVALKYDLMVAGAPRRKSSRSIQAAALLSVDEEQAQAGKKLMSVLGLSSSDESVMPVNLAERRLQQVLLETPAAGSFMQATKKQPNANDGSYTPQSSAIFGILTQMKDEMEANLTQLQKEEMKAIEDFKALMASKTAQIEAGKAKLDEMETEAAENTKALSDAKEDLDLTREGRSADVEFLRNLKVTCQNLDAEWAERSKTRAQELSAVTEAIGILTEDDNADLLRQTVTLLQVVSVTDSDSAAKVRRSRAAAALRGAASLPDFDADDLLNSWTHRTQGQAEGIISGSPRDQLSTLAVSVELDAFTKVKEVMDNMIAELQKQQKEEVNAKALCVKEFDDNEKTTYAKTEEKDDLEAQLESLEKQVTTLKDEIKDATTQIADTQVEIKKQSEMREKDNAEFQSTIADQRATQAILKKALDRLASFYKKSAAAAAAAALLQKSKQTPPVQFNKYNKNAGSSTVMSLIEQIIEDSKKLEEEAISAETKSQADYEAFVKDSNAIVEELSTAVTDKTAAIAKAKSETASAEASHTSTVEELESLAEYLADLHMQCDFLMKNFAIRQKGRIQEIEAIQRAKAILSGMQ